MELVRVFQNRPTTVEHEGWTVHLSVRDAFYLAERQRWLDRIKASHPDRGGSGAAFVAEWERYRIWKRKQRAWYAALGLVPPTEKAMPAPEAVHHACHRCGGAVPRPVGTKPWANYCSRLCSVVARRGRPRRRPLRPALRAAMPRPI